MIVTQLHLLFMKFLKSFYCLFNDCLYNDLVKTSNNFFARNLRYSKCQIKTGKKISDKEVCHCGSIC